MAINRHGATGRVGRNRDVITDVVGVVFQVAVEIRDEMTITMEMRNRGAWTGRQNTNVIRDVGISADGIDLDRFNDVLACIAVNVESEFIIGTAPFAEINRMAGSDI